MTLRIHEDRYIIKAEIDRPKAMNAVNFQLMNELESLLDKLEGNSEIRLFILTGSGKSFISGGDLREFHSLKKADEARVMTKRMMTILNRIENLPCWTLAAINGYAYGGGWETALAFDFRVAVSSAKIGFTQGKFYLPPGWGGIKRLSDLLGKERALFHIAAQSVLSADKALEIGFLQDVFNDSEFDDMLQKLSGRLTLNDRTFIEYLKRARTFADEEEEVEPFSTFWESEEHLKRVDRFLKK